MTRSVFIIIASILVSLIPALATADISVDLKLDRSEMNLSDSVQLVVSVSGSRDTGSEPVIQGLENFRVNPGGSSSRIEFINGKMSSGMEYTYFIQPRQTGTFQIGPASVQINGKNYKSSRAALRVVKPDADQRAGSSPVFLKAELSNPAVYVEEQTVYTLKLYLSRNVRNINLNLPETEHLAFKQLAKPVDYRSTQGGQEYQVIEVRYAVVPSKAGTFQIEPAQMSMTVLEPQRRSNRGFFDDPFSTFSSGRPLTVAGDSLQLTVRPLPAEGKPADFSGLVGKFVMWSKLEPATLKTGESATLTVAVSGQGNINRIPDLKMPALDHIKVYADQPVLESSPDPAGQRGSKTMKWALVPEKDGQLGVPPLTVSFFDTANRTYKTLRSAGYTLAVLPGEKEKMTASASGSAAPNGEGAVKHAVKELGRDIFPVHTAVQDFKTADRLQLEGWLLAVMFGLPLIVYLGTLGGLKLGRRSAAGQADARAKKAAREFFRHYRRGPLTYSQLLEQIRDYLNHRFGLSYGSLTAQESGRILSSNGVGAATVEKMQTVVQKIENAAYTGRGQEPAAVETDLVPLIKKIEKECR